MLYYGVHKRYSHEDLKDVHDALALNHHFIICEYSMQNFEVGFARAIVQHWKNVSHQAGPFTRNFAYIIFIFFFSEVPYNVQSTC